MSDEIVKHRVSVVSRGQAGANTRYHRFEKVIEQPAADNTVFINPDIVQAYDPDRYECWRVLHWGGGWDSSYISVAWMVPARAQSAHLTDGQTDRHSHTARVRRPGSGPHAGGHCRVVTAPALLTDKMRFAVGSLVGQYGQLLLSALPLTSRCTLNGWSMGGGRWLARMNLATLPPQLFRRRRFFCKGFSNFL